VAQDRAGQNDAVFRPWCVCGLTSRCSRRRPRRFAPRAPRLNPIVRCSSSHSLDARLAIEYPSRPTLIDSGMCARPTLIAPEPRLLILGSQSAPAGPHYLHRAVAWWMTVLVRAGEQLPAHRTTGGINNFIRRVWPDFPRSPPRYHGVIARKTRRITRGVPATGSLHIMWAPVQSMWAGRTCQNQ
jgi:hypothetical protein